jgi:hypothetical protein
VTTADAPTVADLIADTEAAYRTLVYDDPIDDLIHAVRARVDVKRNPLSWRAAISVVVAALPEWEAQCALVALARRPALSIHEADMAEALARRLGQPLAWRHRGLLEPGAWEPGRGATKR